MKRPVTFAAGFLLALASTFAAEPDDAVMRAMREELARSTAQLQLENLEKPYFISFRVSERWSQGASASFGSSLGDGESHSRYLNVEVRVGTPALDNTNFQAGFGGGFGGGGSAQLPLDDNITELRRQIWLATDRAYKNAVEMLAKKKAVLQNKTRTDETPDFSEQETANTTDRRPIKSIELAQAVALARDLSGVFRETRVVEISGATINASRELTRYVNSEGTTFVREGGIISIYVAAGTQAADGLTLDDHFMVSRRSWGDLPAKAELLASARELGTRLTALRDAPLIEQYNGPVLFEGQAATEIFAQVFAPNLAARKRPVVEGAGGGTENPFLDKLGARVLADFLNVTDDATLETFADAPMLGGGFVDDEGVPTRAVKLVERGRLKTLLIGRSPVRGVAKSTGSTQGGGPGPTNIVVTANEGRDTAALKAELLNIVQQRGRDYGVIIRRIGNPGIHAASLVGAGGNPVTSGSRDGVRVDPAVLAYKIFPDGHEELVRNIEIAGMTAATFKEILAAGAEPTVNTMPFRGSLIVSIAVPDLLFEEVTLKKPSGEIPKPPVVGHPFFAKQ